MAKEVLKQNNIKRPEPGSVTGKVWDIADDISRKLGRPAPRKDVIAAYMTAQPNANRATANTQYARWVTFHGAQEALRKAREADAAARKAEKAKEPKAEKAPAKAAAKPKPAAAKKTKAAA